MAQIILVGIAAGIAGALLYLSPIGGTFLAFPLFTLCGLPLAIAGLGWNVVASAIAAVVAGAAILFLSSGPAAAIYLVLFAAPILWMSRLAGLSRQDDADGPVEWFPIGRILFHGTLAGAAGLIVVGFIVGYDPEAFTRELTAAFVDWMAMSPEATAPPSPDEIEPFVRFNVEAMPFTVSAIMTFILVFNMWLAARITEASGRLRRPRERMWTAVLPVESAIAFAIAVAASFLPGALGHAGGAFTGALGGAIALIGLAVIHATTVGSAFRTLILVAVYVLVVLFGFPILLLAALGLAETFLHMRARRLRGASSNTE